MKVGFIGAGATGKTTVMRLVAELLGLVVLPSVVRDVFAGFGVAQESDQLAWTAARRWQLQKAIFDARLAAEARHPEGFISDRTILDHLMYCYIRAAEAVTDTASLELEGAVLRNLSTYDALFYFPAGQFVASVDRFRQEGRAYQKEQDWFLRGFMEEHNIPHFVMPFAVPERRAKFVARMIKRTESLVI